MPGARFSLSFGVPASPPYAVTPNTSTPSRPSATSTASGRRSSRRSGQRCSRGSDQSAASATNETTSTPAAAAAKTASGIGRSARPTIPWAKTSTADESRNDDGPASSGAAGTAEGPLPRYFLQEALVLRPTGPGTGAPSARAVNVSLPVNLCFLFLQPVLETMYLLPRLPENDWFRLVSEASTPGTGWRSSCGMRMRSLWPLPVISPVIGDCTAMPEPVSDVT